MQLSVLFMASWKKRIDCQWHHYVTVESQQSHIPDSLQHLPDQVICRPTLVSQIVEHTEIDEHLEQIAENLIVEHLIYTIFIATNNRTSGIFFHCVNSQTRLTIRDTRVGLWQIDNDDMELCTIKIHFGSPETHMSKALDILMELTVFSQHTGATQTLLVW